MAGIVRSFSPARQGETKNQPIVTSLMPHRRPVLSTAAFARIVEQAIARIPAEIRTHLDNVLISVQPRATAAMLAEVGLGPDEPLFGLYTGVPLIDRSVVEPSLYPDTIHIFQEPLEEYCTTREELIEEIEITVVHEIAHLFGFSDAELEDLGYG